jgi:lysine 6-dehydrogenase
MGSLAVCELGRDERIGQVTIVGRNRERAETLAAEVGSRARVEILDVRQPEALRSVMDSHDVAVGALGPFYLYEKPIAEAAIEAGTPYVSICDDYDATQAVLELDDEAKRRGVTILTGMGWTPGITNLCAKKGAQLLDAAKNVHISWVGSAADAEGLAVILHTMHIFTGQVPTFSDGKPLDIKAGSGRRRVRFPAPLGDVAVYHVGHPEPVTIPRFLPGVMEATCQGGLTETFLTYVSIGISRLGLTGSPEKRERLAARLKPALSVLGTTRPESQPLSGAHVEVRGTKDGRPAKVVMTAVDRMARLTSLPLVVGALMLGSRQIDRPGVIAPEAPGGPDPDTVFQQLEQYGLQVRISEIEFLESGNK